MGEQTQYVLRLITNCLQRKESNDNASQLVSKADFEEVSEEEVVFVIDLLNYRPREA